MQDNLIKNAEENDDGELIYERVLRLRTGDVRRVEVNVTKLYEPGPTKTADVERLILSAELAEEGEGGGNPARPSNAKVAKEAIERIEAKGLEPAWRRAEGEVKV